MMELRLKRGRPPLNNKMRDVIPKVMAEIGIASPTWIKNAIFERTQQHFDVKTIKKYCENLVDEGVLVKEYETKDTSKKEDRIKDRTIIIYGLRANGYIN